MGLSKKRQQIFGRNDKRNWHKENIGYIFININLFIVISKLIKVPTKKSCLFLDGFGFHIMLPFEKETHPQSVVHTQSQSHCI